MSGQAGHMWGNKKAANVSTVTPPPPPASHTDVSPMSLREDFSVPESGSCTFVFTCVVGCRAETRAAGQKHNSGNQLSTTSQNLTLLFWHSVLIMLCCVGVFLKLISFNNFSDKCFTTASDINRLLSTGILFYCNFTGGCICSIVGLCLSDYLLGGYSQK